MRNSLTLRLLIINSKNHEVFTSMQWMLTLYTCLIKLVQPIKVSAFHFSRRRQTTPKCTFRGCENILKMAPLKARTELWAYSRGHLGRRRPFFCVFLWTGYKFARSSGHFGVHCSSSFLSVPRLS